MSHGFNVGPEIRANVSTQSPQEFIGALFNLSLTEAKGGKSNGDNESKPARKAKQKGTGEKKKAKKGWFSRK